MYRDFGLSRIKGIARIQDEMIDCEKRIVSQLVSRHLLKQDNYLIKDGSIQYKPMKNWGFARTFQRFETIIVM